MTTVLWHELILSPFAGTLTDEILQWVIHTLPLHRLKVIDLDHCFAIHPSTILSLLTLQHNPSALEVLRLQSCDLQPRERRSDQTDDTKPTLAFKIVYRIKEFKGLRILDLTATCGISARDIHFLLCGAQNLDDRSDDLQSKEGEAEISTFPRLRELGLYPSQMTRSLLEAIGHQLERIALKVFVSSGVRSDPVPLISALRVGRENLRELQVSGGFFTDATLLASIPPCENLRVLQLLSCRIRPKALQIIVNRSPRLEYLEFNGRVEAGIGKDWTKLRSKSLLGLVISGNGENGVGWFNIRCLNLKRVVLTNCQSFFGNLRYFCPPSLVLSQSQIKNCFFQQQIEA